MLKAIVAAFVVAPPFLPIAHDSSVREKPIAALGGNWVVVARHGESNEVWSGLDPIEFAFRDKKIIVTGFHVFGALSEVTLPVKVAGNATRGNIEIDHPNGLRCQAVYAVEGDSMKLRIFIDGSEQASQVSIVCKRK